MLPKELFKSVPGIPMPAWEDSVEQQEEKSNITEEKMGGTKSLVGKSISEEKLGVTLSTVTAQCGNW